MFLKLLKLSDLVSFCAFKAKFNTQSNTVTYDKITLQSNPYSTGELDIATGKFTSPTSGVFSVSFFFSADNNGGSGTETAIETDLYIQKNGDNLSDGQIFTTVFSAKESRDNDSSGKSLLIYLESTDEVSGNIHYV